VRLYCDKLLEEVDEAQAAALRQAENDVSYREGSLRAMREEVSARVYLVCFFVPNFWYLFCCVITVLHLIERFPSLLPLPLLEKGRKGAPWSGRAAPRDETDRHE